MQKKNYLLFIWLILHQLKKFREQETQQEYAEKQ